MHIVFDIDLTLLDAVEPDIILRNPGLHYSQLATFPIGDDYIAFVRPFAIQFMLLAINMGNDLSIWTRATDPYAKEVASFFQDQVDGLKFRHIYSDRKCPTIKGAWRKPLSHIHGDLLIDDNLENRLTNEDRFVQCPEFFAWHQNDDFFLRLFNDALMYDDWDASIFETYIP